VVFPLRSDRHPSFPKIWGEAGVIENVVGDLKGHPTDPYSCSNATHYFRVPPHVIRMPLCSLQRGRFIFDGSR
jgi:hypothetical protein